MLFAPPEKTFKGTGALFSLPVERHESCFSVLRMEAPMSRSVHDDEKRRLRSSNTPAALRAVALYAAAAVAGLAAAALFRGAGGLGWCGAALGGGAALMLLGRRSWAAGATDELYYLARTDFETGLLSPRVLRKELGALLSACRQKRQPLAVVMVRFDELGPLHVAQGLWAGSALLRQTAIAVSNCAATRGGTTYRFHANALVAVLPSTTHAEAERIVERLLPTLALVSERHERLVRLTAACAVALVDDHPDELLLRVERRSLGPNGHSDHVRMVLRPALGSTPH